MVWDAAFTGGIKLGPGQDPGETSEAVEGNLEQSGNSRAFGPWEVAEIPGEKPCMHRENMESLHTEIL